MAGTRTIRPLGLIQQLDVIIGGRTFQTSAVVLKLEVQGPYPLLLDQPWLHTTNIKQNWLKHTLTFRKGKTKIRVSTQEKVAMPRESISLYVE